MNKKKSILESNVLYTIIAIIAGFLIGAIFLMVAGISPAVAYGKLFSSIFSKPKYLVWTLSLCEPADLYRSECSLFLPYRCIQHWCRGTVRYRWTGGLCTGNRIKASGRPSCHRMSGGSCSGWLYLVPDRRSPESKERHP